VEWWAGEAYGARRFVSCFPILVLGFAGFATTWLGTRQRLVVTIAVFVVLNGLLLLQYQLFMHGLDRVAPYPKGFYALVLARFLVPFRLLSWLAG
jgi:CHASE2 domain-containing sensor protein